MKISILFILFNFLVLNAQTEFLVEDLVTEYEDTPLGLDIEKPRFSWKMIAQGDFKGKRQSAYQVLVEDENGKQVWDSEKIDSAISVNIIYDGEKLEPETRYVWEVKVWDEKNTLQTSSSWFETGLFSRENTSAWSDAEWIGGGQEDMILNSHSFTVYKVSYQLQLDENKKSKKAGFVFGANDRRLMDRNKNILGVENGKDESYIYIELDITSLDDGGLAKLNVYRKGYTKDEKSASLIYSFDIPEGSINASNKYSWHDIYLEMNFGKCLLFVNDRSKAINEQENLPAWVDVKGSSFNPLGDNGGDLIVYPALADIGFAMEKGEFASFKELQVMHYRAPSTVIFQEDLIEGYSGIFDKFPNLEINENSYYVGDKTEETLITADPSRNGAPMLRTKFSINKKVKKARIYVTARGVYEVFLNGKRIGENYFPPGHTQYNRTLMYQIYDVTGLLQNGENAIGCWLGEGWWSGSISYRGYNWNYFGDRQSLLMKMKIYFDDGSFKIITSNDEEWKYYNDGPIQNSSFFQGEVYDSRKENAVKNWANVGYDDSSWKKSEQIDLDSTNAYIDKDFNYQNLEIIGQIGDSPRIVKTLEAQRVEEVRPGVFIYDMGQNMVGFPTISLSGSPGDTIVMRYAEMKYPELEEYRDNAGMILMENIRGALTNDIWILKGGKETIQPHFTFHGFRYLEITGIDKALPLSSIKGNVVSSVKNLTSKYETSNKDVNKLWENITRSFRSNFLSIPTDTPARNERMGWNGDINVFAQTATYLANIDSFLKRHTMANRQLQDENGRFPDIAPVGGGFGGVLWGSAGVTIPWQLYIQYEDLRVLQENYEAMKKYVEFLSSKQDPQTGIIDEGPLGDWLSPEGFKNDNSLFWTAYQIRNLEILYKSAQLLGYESDARKYTELYKNRKNFFNKTYVDEETGKTIHSGYSGESLAAKPENYVPKVKGDPIDTQASYSIPLQFGIFDDSAKAGRNLVKTVARKNKDHKGIARPEYSLMTGFVGTAAISMSLSQNNKDLEAYKMLQNKIYPSWLYSVENGATTIWERLDSYTTEDGFGGNNSMNSFNHYSFGAVGAWMYGFSLGIQPAQPGFKSIILKPTPDPTGEMKWAKGYYDSMYGRIESEWQVEENGVRYRLSIPANTKATVYLKAEDETDIINQLNTSNPKLMEKNLTSKENGRIRFELASGDYEFFITRDVEK